MDALHYQELEAKRLFDDVYEVFSQTTNTGCSIYKSKKHGWYLVNPCEVPLKSAETIIELLKFYKEKH